MPLPPDHPVQQLADAIGGTIDSAGQLPDGSGFATMSMPLPKDHWLTAPGHDIPPMPWRMGNGPERDRVAALVRAAGKYALRGATMRGTEADIDPDALLQNLVVGMLGYWTTDGMSHSDPECNPSPPPPLFASPPAA